VRSGACPGAARGERAGAGGGAVREGGRARTAARRWSTVARLWWAGGRAGVRAGAARGERAALWRGRAGGRRRKVERESDEREREGALRPRRTINGPLFSSAGRRPTKINDLCSSVGL
jgi:hypothetical protein